MKVTRALRKLRGSIHPSYYKGLTADKPIEALPMPSKLYVSMGQHLGAPATPIVAKGDVVSYGQCIGEAKGFISAHVHAPAAGTVTAIDTAPNAAGIPTARIIMETDPEPEPTGTSPLAAIPDWRETSRKDLLQRIAAAGIAGMGGAGFPTHVKLAPPPDKPIDTLIINGAECEPYLTADHRLMVEHADEMREGIELLAHILQASQVHIAIENNKPAAIEALQSALEGIEAPDIHICILPTEYPQGAEKQQIAITTGREVPSGGLPLDVGCVVENVGTVLAVQQAVVRGVPLTHRVTTVTGQVVKTPKNILAPIGTSYADLIEYCGGLQEPAAKIISGGPMMGMAQPGLEVSTTKTTSGIVCLASAQVHAYRSLPCISCGRCVRACPMDLLPAEISVSVDAGDSERAEALDIMDCIECGCCAFVCPASRPLVQHFKIMKPRILMKRRQAAAASKGAV